MLKQQDQDVLSPIFAMKLKDEFIFLHLIKGESIEDCSFLVSIKNKIYQVSYKDKEL
jgi:hypothetical protein